VSRSEIVAAARAWVGTPFVLGAAVRGAGCDCLGLIRGIRGELGAPVPARLPPYPPDWALRGGGETLARRLAEWLPEAGPAEAAGQVLLFRLRAGAPAAHLGVLTEAGPAPRFVHAYDRHGVTESPLAPGWARRVVARFELI
jgi:NlpC/P60 family putative phage cell wall peptidase